MAIEIQPAIKVFSCDYCDGPIDPADVENAAHSVSGVLNNPAGRFFCDVTATVHLCATCRGVATVKALDSMLADELENVTDEQRRKFFEKKD